MKAWTRRQFDQLCSLLQDTLGTASLSDDIPAPLIFGQAGNAGVGTKASRSDHRHAMSAAIIGAVPTLFWDVKSGTGGAGLDQWFKKLNTSPGTQNTNAPDDPGTEGAFGMDRLLAGNLSSHIVISQSGTGTGADGDTTDRLHSIQRMSRFISRVRQFPSNTPAGSRSFIGGWHTTVDTNLTTLDDALGFWIQVNSSGVGNWQAYAQSSTTGLTTQVDLGVGWNGRNYQKFEIQYDLTTATFLMDDLVVAEITENIPTEKVFGWGVTNRAETGNNIQEIQFDTMILLGRF